MFGKQASYAVHDMTRGSILDLSRNLRPLTVVALVQLKYLDVFMYAPRSAGYTGVQVVVPSLLALLTGPDFDTIVDFRV